MMNLVVGSSWRRFATVLTGLCASLLCAATFTGSAHAASSIFGTTGSNPYAITIDSAGNIYTANQGSNNVTKITPGGTSTTLGTTGNNPYAITIDSAGNIYTSNHSSNNVSKITPGGTSTILGTTGADPSAITVDSAGNIYTSNQGSNNVTKITPAAAPSNKFVTLPTATTSSVVQSTLVVPGPGVATQLGTFSSSSSARSAKTVTACAGSRTTTKAGRYKINCTLTAGARSARRRGSIRVTLVTTFTPTGATARSITQTITLKKTSSGVTG